MARGPLKDAELRARGVTEARKVVVARNIDGEFAMYYARDTRGNKWKWDPTKGLWRATNKWPEQK